MKPLIFKRSRFKLKKLLDDLHRFSTQNLGDGNPLPAVSGDTVYHDPLDLAEALAADGHEEISEIPGDSLGRLEVGMTLYGQFAAFNGFDGFDCADGQHVDVPCLDDDEEYDEPVMPRRRRTKKYLESVENSVADENSSFGFLISLTGDMVEIEARGMNDVSGECELEPMAEPNLLSEAMRRWLRSFLIPKRRENS
jgi:hypothetical protein